MTLSSPADAAAEKARMLLGVGRNEDAGKAALEGLTHEPDNADLMGLVAAALQAESRPAEARHWAERSLASDPEQAWVQNVRANAMLDGAGNPQEAIQAAQSAVRLDPSNASYRYTLACVYTAAGMKDEAQTAVRSIRVVDPNSVLGPLAEANLELSRVWVVEIPLAWLLAAVVVANGRLAVTWAIFWLAFLAWRAGPVRRADQLVMEALRLNPGLAASHALAAEVARVRLRYAQSVNASLASAAIDAGLISAEDLARQIAQRTATVAVGACFVWKIAANTLYANTPAHMAITHALWVGLAAVIGVVWLDRIQTQRLPAGMLRLVRQRWELPTTAAVLAALGIYIGVVNTWGMPVGWRAAALTPGLAVAACAAVLIAQYLQARRVP